MQKIFSFRYDLNVRKLEPKVKRNKVRQVIVRIKIKMNMQYGSHEQKERLIESNDKIYQDTNFINKNSSKMVITEYHCEKGFWSSCLLAQQL